MPQVIFELSDNVIETDLIEVLAQIHQILVITLPTRLESCKSRIIRHEDFLVGDGNINNAFIHVSIEVLSGRSKETLDLVASKIADLMQSYFKESLEQLNLRISIAVKDLPEIYHRID